MCQIYTHTNANTNTNVTTILIVCLNRYCIGESAQLCIYINKYYYTLCLFVGIAPGYLNSAPNVIISLFIYIPYLHLDLYHYYLPYLHINCYLLCI